MRCREGAGVQLLATLRPAPAAPATGGSIAGWIWLGIALAVIVIGGYILSLRR
jgi:hypothetical protein